MFLKNKIPIPIPSKRYASSPTGPNLKVDSVTVKLLENIWRSHYVILSRHLSLESCSVTMNFENTVSMTSPVLRSSDADVIGARLNPHSVGDQHLLSWY